MRGRLLRVIAATRRYCSAAIYLITGTAEDGGAYFRRFHQRVSRRTAADARLLMMAARRVAASLEGRS